MEHLKPPPAFRRISARRVIVGLIISLGVIQNSWPLISGYLHAPPGAVFLGTIHHPGDYFYYLSQFAQGATRWLTAKDLYTGETIPPTIIGWANVFLGHIFSLAGMGPRIAYAASTVLLTGLCLFAAYRLAKTTLRHPQTALLGLLFFTFYHAFPNMSGRQISFYDYWNNMADPRVRFGGVPHQLLIAALSLWISDVIFRWNSTKTHRYVRGTLLILSGAALASLQPITWALIVSVFGISAIIYMLINKSKRTKLNSLITPIVLVAVGGCFPVIYLLRLFQSEPFIQLKLWEATQHNNLPIFQFLMASGPLFLVALFSLPSVLANPTFPTMALALFACVSVIIFLSPLPALWGLTEVRFLTPLSIAGISYIAADGLSRLMLHLRRRPLLLLVILVVIMGSLIPGHIASLRLSGQFEPNNAYHYLDARQYAFLKSAAMYGNDTQVFLLIWPYNVVFPGITGKTSFNGHPLLTIQSQEKDKQSQRFFDGSLQPETMASFLADAHISYVIGYTWTPNLATLPSLTRIARQDPLVLYRVAP